MYETLSQGEKDRPRLTVPRWQAGYDLSMGRVLALKVRTEGYNAMLAKAKQGMRFQDPKNDTWELVPRRRDQRRQRAGEAGRARPRQYLERVVKEHPGTPWALHGRERAEAAAGLEVAGEVHRRQRAAPRWPTQSARAATQPHAQAAADVARRRSCSRVADAACEPESPSAQFCTAVLSLAKSTVESWS